MKRTRVNRRRGYVLVMTVFVLAIVGLLLVGISSHSFELATQAVIARNDLQQKWLVASCQKYALENSPYLLGEASAPLARTTAQIRLNDTDVEIVLADESAKLDVNFLWANTNPANAKSVVRELAQSQQLTPRLRPLDEKHRDARNDPFEGWGQVFSTEEFVTDFPKNVFDATVDLTCWSKSLNYRTAPEPVLFNAIKAVAGASIAQRLVSELQQNDEASVANAIADATVNGRQRERLNRLLTSRSASQSVWIRTQREGNSSSTLTVNEGLTATIKRLYTFTW